MALPRSVKAAMAVSMAVILTHIPAIASAEYASAQMIPTSVLVDDLRRAQSEEKVRQFLSREDVQKRLLANGVAPDEVSKRIASLSDHDLQNLTNQMDDARYGGDILFTILIVVLIIFLIKRL